jgi:apolipoprotein N-acyltransferase
MSDSPKIQSRRAVTKGLSTAVTGILTPPATNHRTVRIIGGFALAVVSGVLLLVALPTYGRVWPVMFIAVVPAVVAQYRLLPRKLAPFSLGIMMMIYGCGLASIITTVSSPTLLIVVGFGAGATMFLLAVIDRRLAERTNYRFFLIQMPLLWTAVEFLGGSSQYTGTVGWLAYQLAPAPWLIQPVSVFSTPMLTLLILVVNYAIALLIIGLIDRRTEPVDSVRVSMRTATTGFIVGVGVFVLWIVLSLVLLAVVHSQQGPNVRVAAVQPGNSDVRQKNPANEMSDPELIAELADMVKQAAGQGAQLAVLPEEIITFDPEQTNTAEIAAMARDNNINVVIGYASNRGSEPQNAAVLINPQGEFVGRYYKVHRAAFEGERFNQPVVYDSWQTSIGQVGMIICFDGDFPSDTRQVVATGAQLIADPSWDFGGAANYELVPVTFRAVENRVALVKADHAWDSGIIAPDGTWVEHTISTSERGTKQLLVADVPLGPRGAPFTSWGYLFGYLIVLGALVRLVAQPIVWARRDR